MHKALSFFETKISFHQLILFILSSLCFTFSYKTTLPIVIVIGLFDLYRYIKNQLNSSYFFETYFYVLIYSSVFQESIHKVFLIILLLFFGIYSRKERKNSIDKKVYITEYLFLGYFVLTFINHLIFPPYLKGIEIHIYFLLIPILFILIKKSGLKVSIEKAFKTFILANILVTFLLLIINLFEGSLTLKTNTFLPKSLGIIHVYYGIYIGVACSFLLFLFIKKKYFISKTTHVLTFLFFVFMLAYTGARTSLIGIAIIFIVQIYSLLKWNLILKIFSVLTLTFILMFFGSKIPRVQHGIKEFKELQYSISTNNNEKIIQNSWKNMYMRYLVFKYTFSEVKNHYLLGVGIQNVKSKISKKIIEDGYIHFSPKNSHNQFLNTLIGMGVFSLLYLLFLFSYSIKLSEEYFLFFVFFILISITESTLVRGKGILIFSFTSLLLLLKPPYISND